jgi:hypothetical protein
MRYATAAREYDGASDCDDVSDHLAQHIASLVARESEGLTQQGKQGLAEARQWWREQHGEMDVG